MEDEALRAAARSLAERRAGPEYHDHLGDFTVTWRIVTLALLALGIGIISGFVAWVLLKLIGLVTHIAFFGDFGWSLISPAKNHLGLWVIPIPIIGGIIVGLMARYGSERIRGHGIPEALESILLSGSEIAPRVSVLKPTASAIAIGTGGPFGAEGPIIVTGGAFGSLLAQLLDMTSAERKTLLVAGAAGGMAAVFGAPVAATLLAVELMLFEWKPRSLIPVAVSCAAADVVSHYMIRHGALFHVPPHDAFIGIVGLLFCVVCGLLAGALSTLASTMVYGAEDGYRRLPVHWMWWPAIGGLFVGVGGYFVPRALGVGYDVIGDLLQGNMAIGTVVGILVAKTLMWSISLASGTSGGILAPLLMMGGALGALEAHVFPAYGAGFWALVSMGAVLGSAMNTPFVGIIFSLELTHDVNMLLPLLIAVMVADGVTILAMKRSILTEKLARRGQHLTREYSIDPLEILSVGDVMRSTITLLPADATPDTVPSLDKMQGGHFQRLFPVVCDKDQLVGVVTRKELQRFAAEHQNGHYPKRTLSDLATTNVVVAYPEEPLRQAVYRMAETGLTRFPVVEPGTERKVVGIVALTDLLRARERDLVAEQRRERILHMRMHTPRKGRITTPTRDTTDVGSGPRRGAP